MNFLAHPNYHSLCSIVFVSNPHLYSISDFSYVVSQTIPLVLMGPYRRSIVLLDDMDDS